MAETVVGDLVARLRADIIDFKSGMSDAAKHMDSVGKKMQSVGTKMSIGITAPLALVGKAAFDAAKDLAESMSKSEQIFEKHSKAVDKWAKGAAEDFGQSRQQALEAASSFGNMFRQLGVGIQPAMKMSKTMTELASDFASFHNADITEVLLAQSSAFRGEYDALQRFLPLINAANVEQKAMAMTGKDNARELTAQEKALAVYALMLEGAGKALGDYDRTADGAANKQRELMAKWDDTKAQLGQALIPLFQQVAGALQKVAEWFSDLTPRQQEFIVYAGLVVAALGPVIGTLGTVIRTFGIMANVLAANPYLALIAASAAAAILIIKNWDSIVGAVRGAVNAVIGEINNLIRAWNSIPLLPNVGEIGLLGSDPPFYKPGVDPNALGPPAPGPDYYAPPKPGDPAFIGPVPGAPPAPRDMAVPWFDDLQAFASGGRVPGPLGAPVPILAHGGEVVLNRAQQAGMGNTYITIHAAPFSDERKIAQQVLKVLAQARNQGFRSPYVNA